ncbi:cGMP-dependent protein kinase, isozyme 1-like isoform X2 [Cimex lectularius]|uniref:cGMP-dependent protein kinase n=1 Tax=Cimex lectularius TaxID=79782 RepID=A0A8I6RGV8_CIMLE|nr:cGMP-dependent protein kinase, isozyme 1-like isoform X2 [Cimex lectularius]
MDDLRIFDSGLNEDDSKMEGKLISNIEMNGNEYMKANGKDDSVRSLERRLSKLCSREKRVSFKTDQGEDTQKLLDKGRYEQELQKLYGEFVEKRAKREVAGTPEEGPKRAHVCNSLFGTCGAAPVSLSDILADDMGNGAPSKHSEILALKKELRKKDQMLLSLQREIHKLRSVLHQSVNCNKDEFLRTLHQVQGMAGQTQTNKKQGVSAESSGTDQTSGNIQLIQHDKDFKSKQLIKSALLENDFLKNLEPGQMRDIVDCMYSRVCIKGSFLIKEGEAGSHLYVSASGQFEVIKEGAVLGTLGPGKAFGELAILYNCTRTASIRVVENAEVWVLDRRVFKNIMLRSGLQRLEDSISFLQSVPLLHNLSQTLLCKIADSMQLEFYPGGQYIVRQGATGDTFYILSCGNVKVTQKLPGEIQEEEVRTLSRGDYFGEQALLKEDSRTANVIALPPGVECLTLDRESFMLLIGDLSELQEKDYGDKARLSRPPSANSFNDIDNEIEHVEFKDLQIVATLGVGGFGRVELVTTASNVFALKCLKKCHIVETQQQTHVYSERDIMFSVRSPFVCRLYQTFRDDKYVYLLMEACLGGEVWSLLRDRTCFDDTTACFITACVILALEYLHTRNIVYRDLKPENLLFDAMGYVKLVDFGFAKKLGTNNGKTWTFCGTPEYVAPEVILNKGHDRSVDYWALGILMHELLTGIPPFSSTDPMKTYTLILKGIESVAFPRHVSKTAQNLIKRLCREVPGERLGSYHGGISDIKKHKWFQGFDWQGLESRTLTPPVTPVVNGPTDVSNFDHFTKDDAIPPDELSGWDNDF